MQLVIPLTLVIAGLALILPPIIFVFAAERWRHFQDRRLKRRHPLSRGLLRPPGHTLSEQLRELGFELAATLFVGPLAGFIFLLVAFVPAYFSAHEPPLSLLLFGGATAALAAIWSGFGALRIYRASRVLRLGWEGEVATAEDLNKLMRLGYAVFHDVPCDGFNIDHIIVGPAGVFAVETKTRTKQKRARTEADWKAVFDGKTINFAGFKTKKDLDQARRQSRWLAMWLYQSTGEKTQVTPVVTLPGWMVERRANSDVRVINPSEATTMVSKGSKKTLDEAQIQRITHQLDQKCRNLIQDKIKKINRVGS